MTREEAIANLKIIRVAFVDANTAEQAKLIDETFDMAIEALEQEPKAGHWEYVQYDYNSNIGNWHCSECRTIAKSAPMYKYCPNCGAKMKAESEEKNDGI
jgi:rubrerythrin